MRFLPRPWLLPLLAVAAFVVLLQGFRVHRIGQLSALPSWSVDRPAFDAASPTGYAHGWRQLLVEDPTGQSQQWIAQIQLMLHEGRWRLHHVDYDNAPEGRPTHLPLAYRWWLAGLTWSGVAWSDKSTGLAAEQVALYADLLLQALLIAATVWFCAQHFGRLAATLAGVALLTLHPLATQFAPGAPQAQGLAEFAALWSLLLLAAGLRANANPPRLFFLAGLVTGLGLSLNLNTQLVVIGGTVLGALLARGAAPWRQWGLGAALASVILYAADNFPDHLTLRLEANHPLYALGCLALGELLRVLTSWLDSPRERLARRDIAAGVAALLSVGACIGFAMWRHPSFLANDITLTQLGRLNGGFAAADLGRWLQRDGGSLRVWATLLPAGLLCAGMFVSLRQPGAHNSALLLLTGPLAVTAGLGAIWLRAWNTFDAMAVVALVTVLDGRRAGEAVGWIAGVTVSALAGLVLLVPPRTTFHAGEFSPMEMQLVMERDLAQWLALRRPNAIALAPPALTASLWYYGGIRGITSFDPANREGILGALRIAGAPTAGEAQVLLARRQVALIVLPATDLGLDTAAREVSGTTKSLFIEQLRSWLLPGWIRPVAYYLPPIPGFTTPPPVVLEISDERSDPEQIGDLATFFIESGLPDHARELRKFARRHGTDIGALAARAELERLAQDGREFDAALAEIDLLLKGRADRNLDWNRRLALAAVLVQGNRPEAARQQATRCFAEADEPRLRELSPRSLFRLLALGRRFHLQFKDPHLDSLARALLPPEFRTQLP